MPRTALLVLAVVTGLVAASGQSRPTADETLWAELQQRTASLAELSTLETDAAVRLRSELIDRCRVYTRLYPGGPRLADVAAMELRTRYQVDGLTDRAAALPEGVAYYAAERFPRLVRSEAAYWAWQGQAGSGDPLAAVAGAKVAAALELVERYAGLPRAAQLTQLLCEEFERHPDAERIARLRVAAGDTAPRVARLARLGAALPSQWGARDGWTLIAAGDPAVDLRALERAAAAARDGWTTGRLDTLLAVPGAPPGPPFDAALPEPQRFVAEWVQRPGGECFLLGPGGVLRAILAPGDVGVWLAGLEFD